MALILVITEGPRAGDRFKLKPGILFGRAKADINLRDPKVSNRHALIQEVTGDLVLVDQGSTNGIKVEGKKVNELVLKAGLKFTLGSTLVEIVEEVEEGDDLEEWRRTLLRAVSRAQGFVQDSSPMLKAFYKPVEIQFLEGQARQSRIFSYGPRNIDPFSLDLDVDIPATPPIFFELIPEGEHGIRFRTPHPDFVKLNGQPVEADVIKDGDIILIQDVELKVVIK